MVRTGTIALLLLACGCSADNGSELPADNPSEAPRDLRVERISSGAPGQGPDQPRVIIASSATALSGAAGADVPDSGNGTYLAVYWGERPTGGYSLAVESARLEGELVTVRLALEKPPRSALVTQALTYPYAVAVVRDLDPGGMDFFFTDQNGQKLGWPVRLANG